MYSFSSTGFVLYPGNYLVIDLLTTSVPSEIERMRTGSIVDSANPSVLFESCKSTKTFVTIITLQMFNQTSVEVIFSKKV
jgi:hypothetical protein